MTINGQPIQWHDQKPRLQICKIKVISRTGPASRDKQFRSNKKGYELSHMKFTEQHGLIKTWPEQRMKWCQLEGDDNASKETFKYVMDLFNNREFLCTGGLWLFSLKIAGKGNIDLEIESANSRAVIETEKRRYSTNGSRPFGILMFVQIIFVGYVNSHLQTIINRLEKVCIKI